MYLSNMYYVYLYVDPRNDLPFYVGKGKNTRAYSHLSETVETTENKRKFYRIQSIRKQGLEPEVKILKYFQNENDAYDFEEHLIEKYGRYGYDKAGILTNITLGNRPPSRKGKKMTEEQKEKMRGRKRTEEQIEKMRGRIPWNKGKKGSQTAWNKGKSTGPRPPMKEETKEKLRQCHIGKPRPPEVVEKMKKGMKGRVPWHAGSKGTGLVKAWNRNPCIFISPKGEEFEFESQAEGCRELGLPQSWMSEVKNGKRKDCRGWTLRSKGHGK